MINALIRAVFGTKHERDAKRMRPTVEAINALAPELETLDDAALQARTAEFRKRLADGEELDDLLLEAFAACREAGARLGVTVRECDLRSLRPTIAASQPYAVIVMEDLYRFDREAFDSITRQAPASLVRIDRREAQDEAARRLLIDAIIESAATEPSSGIRSILT